MRLLLTLLILAFPLMLTAGALAAHPATIQQSTELLTTTHLTAIDNVSLHQVPSPCHDSLNGPAHCGG